MCLYCEGDNQNKQNIMVAENFSPVCIWKENEKHYLLVDDGDGYMKEIKYCPMCGRKLG